jgi:hypothetical protein
MRLPDFKAWSSDGILPEDMQPSKVYLAKKNLHENPNRGGRKGSIQSKKGGPFTDFALMVSKLRSNHYIVYITDQLYITYYI